MMMNSTKKIRDIHESSEGDTTLSSSPSSSLASKFGKRAALKLKKKTVKKRNTSSPFFYKVTNHHELFKIGTSFYQDFKKGVKSFAISSTGYQQSQQRSILGLASFFDHEEDFKICIISDNLYHGAFKEIISATTSESIDLPSRPTPLDCKRFYNHFDFIDMNLLTEMTHHPEVDYFAALDELVDEYDLVFWDVPELHRIQPEKESYFPIIMKFDSLSIIVAQCATSTSDIEEVRSFFLGYGINLKGFLLDPQRSEKGEPPTTSEPISKEKKSWWKGLFK